MWYLLGCPSPREGSVSILALVQADRFHKTGRQLRSKMWWQNMKMKLIIAGIVAVLILVLVAIICLSGTNRCKSH